MIGYIVKQKSRDHAKWLSKKAGTASSAYCEWPGHGAIRAWFGFLAFLVLAPTVAGCVGVGDPYYVKADGRIIPLHWGDVPPIGQEKAKFKLRYDVLYVADQPVFALGRVWYRFWPDGQVMESYTRSSDSSDMGLPTASDGDIFEETGCGRYAIDGTELRMAFAGRGEAVVVGSAVALTIDEGTVYEDGSFTVDSFGEGIHFRPTEVGEMKRYPDW